ncbi:MAG: flagellar basal body P-ring formation chaperone FlgA [Myxococcota bacterium]
MSWTFALLLGAELTLFQTPAEAVSAAHPGFEKTSLPSDWAGLPKPGPGVMFWARATPHRDSVEFQIGARAAGRAWSPIQVRLPKVTGSAVLVVARDIAPGVLLRSEDIEMSREARSDASLFVQDPAKIIGRTLKRGLRSGAPIRKSLVAAPIVVERGQKVDVLWGSEGLKIRLVGVALQPGAVGERIRVMNRDSNKMLRGRVTPSGQVEVLR